MSNLVEQEGVECKMELLPVKFAANLPQMCSVSGSARCSQLAYLPAQIVLNITCYYLSENTGSHEVTGSIPVGSTITRSPFPRNLRYACLAG